MKLLRNVKSFNITNSLADNLATYEKYFTFKCTIDFYYRHPSRINARDRYNGELRFHLSALCELQIACVTFSPNQDELSLDPLRNVEDSAKLTNKPRNESISVSFV